MICFLLFSPSLHFFFSLFFFISSSVLSLFYLSLLTLFSIPSSPLYSNYIIISKKIITFKYDVICIFVNELFYTVLMIIFHTVLGEWGRCSDPGRFVEVCTKLNIYVLIFIFFEISVLPLYLSWVVYNSLNLNIIIVVVNSFHKWYLFDFSFHSI